MSTARAADHTRYSEAEYLAFERSSPEKHEFFCGELFLMTGASRWHNLIVTNLCWELRQQLRDCPCRVYPSDLRIRVPSTGLFTYPDVTIVCGQENFLDEHVDTLLNPTVIIEVLSDSTEKYDRGRKFEHYRLIPSLRAYVLVAQDRASVEQFEPLGDGSWRLSCAQGLDAVLDIPALGGRLTLAEIYDKVEFPPPGSESAEPLEKEKHPPPPAPQSAHPRR